jgi:hypothetical protein
MKNYLFSLVTFLVVLGIFIYGLGLLSQKSIAEGAETLERALVRSSVQCYAIEGRYPPSVQYLEDHYGIQIDSDKYVVFYEGFASNLMPDITVAVR